MSVLVTHRPIAVHPDVFEAAPVGFEIAFLFLPESACHPDPWLFDAEFADRARFYRFPILVENVHVHSWTRSRERTRLDRQQRITHQNAARDLGAARVVDDR